MLLTCAAGHFLCTNNSVSNSAYKTLLQPAFVNFDKFFFLPVKKFQSQSSGQYICVSMSLCDAYSLLL